MVEERVLEVLVNIEGWMLEVLGSTVENLAGWILEVLGNIAG